MGSNPKMCTGVLKFLCDTVHGIYHGIYQYGISQFYMVYHTSIWPGIYHGISHLMVYHSKISHIRYITWYMPGYIYMVYLMVYIILYVMVYPIPYTIHGMLYIIYIYHGISHLMVYHSVISHIRYITWYMKWYIAMVYHLVYIILI